MKIKKNQPVSSNELGEFLKQINFKLPIGFVEFFTETNGAEVEKEQYFFVFWPVSDMIKLNKAYHVEKYASDYFIIGSDNGDTAYCIQKTTGYIYEMPFIGMANNEASFIYKDFNEFLYN